MRDFKDAYKAAVRELPEYVLDASKVTDELHHRRMNAARRRKVFAQTAAAACVFLLLGVGSAAAVNYRSSRIETRENGFSFVGAQAQVPSEELYEEAGEPEMAAFLADGEEAEPRAAAEDSASLELKEVGEAQEPEGLECEITPVEATYFSLAEFQENCSVVTALPQLSWLSEEEPDMQEVTVTECGDSVWVMVRIAHGEKHFCLSQYDHGDNLNYASSHSFSGEAVNERVLISDQGLEYQVFDSMEEGEITGTHAAIAVNGRDLTVSFLGYDTQTVDTVLKQMDLSIYFGE